MTSDAIRVATIGAGRVADLYLQAITDVHEIELMGVYDVNKARRASRAAEFRTFPFESYEAVLDSPNIDAVLILTPVTHHVDMAIAAAAAGKHVFLEKPIASSSGEAQRLATAVAQSGRVVMPAHNYAYVPEFQRLVRLVQAGSLGTIRAIFIHYVIQHPEEIAKSAGGVLSEVMIHHTYLATTLLGPPQRVYAGTMEPAWLEHSHEDQAWMTWEYEGGLSAHHFATFATDDMSSAPWTFLVRVLGTEGTAEVNWRTSIFAHRVPKGTLAYGIGQYEESYAEELRAFASAVASGSPPLSTLEDGVRAVRIVDAAYRAAGSFAAARRVEGGHEQW